MNTFPKCTKCGCLYLMKGIANLVRKESSAFHCRCGSREYLWWEQPQKVSGIKRLFQRLPKLWRKQVV